MICLTNAVAETKRLNTLYATGILDTEPEQVFDDIVQLAASVCEVPVALISFVDRGRQWFKSRLGMEATETPRELSFCSHAIQQDKLMIIPDAHKDPIFCTNAHVTGHPFIRFYAGQPLVASNGDKLGTLCVVDHVARTLSPLQQNAMRVLAQQVMVQIELKIQVRALHKAIQAKQVAESHARVTYVKLKEVNTKLLELSTTDGLTQIKNRRCFDETLHREFERSRRLRTPLSLLLLDIDCFKAFNDTYGHVQGDIVLQKLAAIMKESTRLTDAVARVGGEEFAVILPDTDQAMAYQLAGRLRKAVENAEWEHRQVTVSVGAGTLGPEPRTPSLFVDDVDKALYKAKMNGRNQVCLAESSQPSTLSELAN